MQGVERCSDDLLGKECLAEGSEIAADIAGRWISCLRRVVLAVTLLALSLATAAWAQNITATIEGVVTDPTGARVPNASVSVMSMDTNLMVYSGKTGEDGSFHATQLPIGLYKLTIHAQGFAQEEIPDIYANVEQTIDRTIRLVPSNVEQSVVVSAENTVYLNKTDATVSTLIEPAEVDDLPLVGRNVANLFTLVPGVSYGGSSSSINVSQLSFNGSRTLNTEVLLNGVSVVDAITGGIMTLPVPDAIQEVRVITSNASAEYGRTSGATISMVSKAGLDRFHGFMYYLFRNEDLDANNYFFNLAGHRRAPDRYNEFGLGLGGPVAIPHTKIALKGTFFFYDFDETLTKTPSQVTETVMSSAFRTGNFSGSSTVIYDPTTNQPFPSNTIPQSRIDPAAAAILAQLPQPSSGLSNASYNYFAAESPQNTYTKNTFRVDHAFTQNIRAFAAVNRFTSSAGEVVVFNSLLNQNGGTAYAPGYEVSTGYTDVIRPSLIADLRFGYSRQNQYRQPTSLGDHVSQTLNIASLPRDVMPNITTSGYASMGTLNSQVESNTNNTYGYTGNLTKLLGHHTIVAGGQLRKNEFNAFSPFNFYNGQLNFDGEMTNKSGTANQTVNAAADFLLGLVKTASYEIPQPETGRRNYNMAFFTQDTWKFSQKLTVDLGLRWEYESPMRIATNIYSNFDPNSGILKVAGENASDTLNVTTSKKNFGPHVGLAFSPRPDFVVRSGFAIFYGQLMSNLGSSVAFPGYDVVTNFGNLGTKVPQTFRLYQGIPLTGVQNLQNPGKILGTGSPSSPINPVGPGFEQVNPMSADYQWNLGIQQQLDSKSIFEVNYVGDRGLHLPLFLHGNLPAFADATEIAYQNTTAALQAARPFPNIGAMQNLYQVGESSYHALQVVASRHASPGLSFQGGYTWSKAIDDGSGIYNYSLPGGLGASQFPSIPNLRRLDRSVGSFDRRNTATISAIYISRGSRWVRDFHLSGLFIANGGLPLTITQTNLFPGIDSQRPNGDSRRLRVSSPYVQGVAVQYFAPTSATNFPISPSGPLFFGTGSSRVQVVPTAFGNLPRNSVREPGERNLDISVSRTFPVYREMSFQFRVDAFNVLNFVNLGSPNASLAVTTNAAGQPIFNSPNFGQITTALAARTLQLSARIYF